jgi:hypothetical protein
MEYSTMVATGIGVVVAEGLHLPPQIVVVLVTLAAGVTVRGDVMGVRVILNVQQVAEGLHLPHLHLPLPILLPQLLVLIWQ